MADSSPNVPCALHIESDSARYGHKGSRDVMIGANRAHGYVQLTLWSGEAPAEVSYALGDEILARIARFMSSDPEVQSLLAQYASAKALHEVERG